MKTPPAPQAANEALMRALAGVLPAQGSWTEDDYLWLTERTNRLIELRDGHLEVLPMPTEHHQRIVLALYRLLYAFVLAQQPGGIVLVAPLRLRLRANHYREPDLLYLRAAADPRRANDSWSGADLVAEVVSPGSATLDTVTKRAEYAQAGISEYWLVNPQAQTFSVLALRGDSYSEHGIFQPGETASSALLPALRIDVAELLAATA
jgi:Uma2 family endonuclease